MQIVDYIKSIEIKKYDEATLMSKAINYVNNGRVAKIDRYMVDYLRHATNGYNDIIHKYAYDPNLNPYYYVVKICLLEKIGEVYPYLSIECNRQIKGVYHSSKDKKTKLDVELLIKLVKGMMV